MRWCSWRWLMGVSIREAGAWLWEGLPQAWAARTDAAGVQAAHLPLLHEALASERALPEQTANWAAVDYALRQVGWEGLLTYRQTGAWHEDWQQRLTAVQSDLDDLLARRTAAILAQNESAFLATAVPEQAAAQQRWLASLDAFPLSEFTQTAVPLALFEDGSVLAQVTMNYELRGRGPSTAEMAILFRPGADGTLWAGKRLHDLPGETAVVRYPDHYEEKAAAVQEKATAWTPRLAAMLTLSPTLPLEIELYDAPDDMRAAIALPYPATNWTEPGQAIKLQAEATDGELFTQLARQLLFQAGVREEWLLRGIPAFLSARFDGGETQRELALRWPDLQTAVAEEDLPDLAALAPELEMSQVADGLAEIAAWDAVRYAVHVYGWEALTERVAGSEERVAGSEGRVASGEGRVASGEGRVNVVDLQREWAESLAQGHIRPEWVAATAAFDSAAAMDSVEILAAEALKGRLAGTPGADTAAEAIADAFRSAGLQPAGDDGSYFQTVPITTSQTIDPIRLELLTPAAGTVSFAYRDEFLPVQPTVGGELISGPLYLVQGEADYEGIDFDGGIVVRPLAAASAGEVERAVEHGAGGLILAGFKRDDKDLYGKTADALLETAAIPVLELTEDGYSKLLTTLDLERSKLKTLAAVQALDAQAQLHYAVTPPQPAVTRNVLAVLPGSDPLLNEEVILVGTHYDYVGDDGDGRRYGGANEATGAAAMIEIARLWQETGYRPQRTILFAAWSGQELGSAGSRFYVANPARPLADTIALIEIEGVGGGGGIALGAQGDEARDGWLLSGIETAVSQLDGKVVITPVTSESDQASFADQAFPTLLISWRLAGDDNLSSETGHKVEAENVQFAGQSAALLLMSLAQ